MVQQASTEMVSLDHWQQDIKGLPTECNATHPNSLSLTRQQHKSGPVAAYSDSRISKIATLVTSVVSALLPVAAVLILFYVKATHDRIYIMLGLTALFAFALAILTSAKHHEIFAATAA